MSWIELAEGRVEWLVYGTSGAESSCSASTELGKNIRKWFSFCDKKSFGTKFVVRLQRGSRLLSARTVPGRDSAVGLRSAVPVSV